MLSFVAAAGAAVQPSFLVFFADDMGFSQPSGVSDRSSSTAGDNGTISTPHLDRFAAEGISFLNWYSAFHVCSPSRAAMMTGRLPMRMGIGWIGSGSNGVFTSEAAGGIPANETTIAEVLGPNGYYTAAIGKWHLGQREKYLPTNHGFHRYYGIPYSCDMGISAWAHAPRPGHGNITACPFACRPLPLIEGSASKESVANNTVIEQPVNLASLTQRYADKAAEYLAEAKALNKPFYLYIAWNHVHSPNFASHAFCGLSKRGPIGDAAQEMDAAIGQVMATVKKLGLDEDTLMFFTSDNGSPLGNDCRRDRPSGNGPLRDGKFTTWEGGVREPGAVRWGTQGKLTPAAGLAVGGLSPEFATTYDIFPTILAVAKLGDKLPAGLVIDGRDLSPVLFGTDGGKGQGRSLHECLYIYHTMAGGQKGALLATGGVAAVRCGKYKAHYWTHSSVKVTATGGPCGQKPFVPAPVLDGDHLDSPVLFDLEKDMGETAPLANSTDEYKQAMSTINAALHAHLATVTHVPNQMCAGEQHHAGMSCVGGSSLDYTVCEDPQSQLKLPDFPNCTSNPENFNQTLLCPKTSPQPAGYFSIWN